MYFDTEYMITSNDPFGFLCAPYFCTNRRKTPLSASTQEEQLLQIGSKTPKKWSQNSKRNRRKKRSLNPKLRCMPAMDYRLFIYRYFIFICTRLWSICTEITEHNTSDEFHEDLFILLAILISSLCECAIHISCAKPKHWIKSSQLLRCVCLTAYQIH